MGYGWNVTRVGDANDTDLLDTRLRGVQGRGGPADADRRRQPHRLGLAAQAGHRGRPRRAAGRGGGAGDQARLRLARGRPVPRPRRGQGALRRRGRQARRRAARRVEATLDRATPPSNAELAAEIEAMQKRAAARRLGRRHPQLRGRREGDRHPQGLAARSRTRSPRGCPGCSPARPTSPTRPRSGSTSTAPTGLRARRLRRPPAPLRHPRARVGGDLQRPLALQAAAALVDLPHLLRLRAAGDPALGADGAAGDPPLHPRLDRARRGRADPPAGRAARLAAGDPRPRRDPPRRRQRGRRGLAGGDRPHPPAGRPRPHPPERAGPRPRHATPRPRGCGAAATCSPTPRAATRR